MKQRHSFRRSVLIFTSIYCLSVFAVSMLVLSYLINQYACRKLKTSLTASVYSAALSLENGADRRDFSDIYGYTIQISIFDENKDYICGDLPRSLRKIPVDTDGLRTVSADQRKYYVLDLQTEDPQGNLCYIRGCTDNTYFFNGLYLGSFECDLSGKYSSVITETRAMAETCSQFSDSRSIPEGTLWYSKEVCFSLYDRNSMFLCGKLPEGFRNPPVNTSGPVFQDDWNRDFISYDVPLTLQNGEHVYLRGVSRFAEFSNAVQLIFRSAFLLIPVLILLLIFLLQWMLVRALSPVGAVIDQTQKITSGKDLSRRVKIAEQSEEFVVLTDTVNGMLERLEDSFTEEARFSGDAAHELRTPLTVILSQCEYLLEEKEMTEDIRSSVKSIYDHASYMSGLVSILLNLSRMENNQYPADFEPVDLCMLVPSVLEECEPDAQAKHIAMQYVCREPEVMLSGDLTLLIQIVSNLVQNAIRYGRENGMVRVTVEKQGEQVILKVIDNGIGISEKDCKHIFHRFFRADPSRASVKGYGLGLSMTERAVCLHHGEITVESCLHKGSTFTVVLPVTQSSARRKENGRRF